jgi:hypothetical protein
MFPNTARTDFFAAEDQDVAGHRRPGRTASTPVRWVPRRALPGALDGTSRLLAPRAWRHLALAGASHRKAAHRRGSTCAMCARDVRSRDRCGHRLRGHAGADPASRRTALLRPGLPPLPHPPAATSSARTTTPSPPTPSPPTPCANPAPPPEPPPPTPSPPYRAPQIPRRVTARCQPRSPPWGLHRPRTPPTSDPDLLAADRPARPTRSPYSQHPSICTYILSNQTDGRDAEGR